MTIAASGPLRLSALKAEYAGPAASRLWRDYRMGTNYVRANGASNSAVNGSAGVPTSGPIRLTNYRGKAAGWTYTNAGTIVTSGDHIWMHPFFVVDWNGNDWPKTFVNNGVLGSNSVSYYPFVIYQGAGVITFINNNEIQGAGGAGAVYGSANAGAGQHAVVVTQCTTQPRIINNANIRGGGGGGGWGGAGGTGGQGYYVYTAQEGPIYDGNSRVVQRLAYSMPTHNGGNVNYPGGSNFYWGGGDVAGGQGQNTTAVAVGGVTYYRYTLVGSAGSTPQYNYYYIYRQFAANAYTSGGGGGIGGNGGRGIGYNSVNLGGTGGAGGAAGGTNAGGGGTGGTGGTGGSWGAYGNTGNTGGTSAGGNYTGASGGAGGSGGGANGAAIYSDSAWSLLVGGALYGSYTGTAPT
jgi:hypothetical protein